MCGIAGFISINNVHNKEELRSRCISMTDMLTHRGPDGSGVWVDESTGIALGHRRLSIIDLSAAGHQPMISHSGRYVIILNGEIYNFKSLRKELEGAGHKFRGHSDTEVALLAIEEWGFDNALAKFNGMFAFALWDHETKVLRLTRDRLGEKPLYYGRAGNNFIFASELKAFRKHPDFKPEINRQALALYLKYSYVPTPYSIYNGVFKLPPGTVLTLKNPISGTIPEPSSYWSVKRLMDPGMRNLFRGSEDEAAEELNLLLKDAVSIRMESDVPLGIFLSGGIDSSIVSALASLAASRPARTFTIGFHEKSYNEAEKAREVAKYLGTEHAELYVKPEDSLKVIPKIADIYDEPFADSSQIPTYLVSKLTRNYVTVALSGDGGDELFGGYGRYVLAESIWQKISLMPPFLRATFARLLTSIPGGAWNALSWGSQSNFSDKVHRLAGLVDSSTAENVYYRLISFWEKPDILVKGMNGLPETALEKEKWRKDFDFKEWMMGLDLTTYLPDDILTKVDRASMAVSLESRAVFLDHRIAEFALSLPVKMKIRQHKGKMMLRKILSRYVPKKLVDVPKMGFGVPLDSWLRGPLRPWAEDLLSKDKIERDGFLESGPIRQKWAEHLSGSRNWQHHLWNVLIFQAWKERWI